MTRNLPRTPENWAPDIHGGHIKESRCMRIAQIAPLFEAVPPKLYGGTERVVHSLTEELVALGHDVTLFASGDSVTSAKLAAMRPEALRLDPTVKDWVAHYMKMVEQVARRFDEFDVIHSHIDYFPLGLLSRQRVPFLTTLHGRLDLPEFNEIYGTYAQTPFVSISDHQRKPIPQLNWARTVLHGMPADRLRPLDVERDYFAFLGRVSPEKGLDRAIRIAAAAGVKLKVAAKVDNADKTYFDNEIKPLLSTGHVEFIGEINDEQKPAFLSGAHALLFPIRWPEPFGLVMIEAMACGTPVIAFRDGSVPEVMEDGLTGFIVESEEEALAALKKIPTLDRARVRARFDERFTARRMAQDYVDLYQELIDAANAKSPRLRAVSGGN
jgi:glycosyltransferase involved in cell wall biosynthesis